jgi:hypothetical protein
MSPEMSKADIIKTLKEGNPLALVSPKGPTMIGLEIEGAMREISMLVGKAMSTVSYETEGETGPINLELELSQHRNMLKIAEEFRDEQYGLTAQTVDKEMRLERTSQFVSSIMSAILISIVKTIIRIKLLLKGKSPVIPKVDRSNELLTLGILQRSIIEINKQKRNYEKISNPNKELSELINIMGEINQALSSASQSLVNKFKANSRRFTIVGMK